MPVLRVLENFRHFGLLTSKPHFGYGHSIMGIGTTVILDDDVLERVKQEVFLPIARLTISKRPALYGVVAPRS